MTPSQRQLIRQCKWRLRELSDDEFVAEFGIDLRQDREFVPSELRSAMASRSSDDVADVVYLAYRFRLSRTWGPILAKLLEQEWHISHEDLANALQDIRDPSTVDALFHTARERHSYFGYDDGAVLAVKCIWALHDIGTDAAIERLERLASVGPPDARDLAKERLVAISARRPGDPVPRYRQARDASVRPT